MHRQNTSVTLRKSTFSVRCSARNFTAHYSSLKQLTGDSLLDMLENWLLPQLSTNYDDYILQLDGAPPSCTGKYESFSFVFFNSAGSDVLQKRPQLLPWTHRSPDLTQRGFLLWGFVKHSVFVPPFPMSLKELRDQITHSLQSITAEMLHLALDEFDYHVGVSCDPGCTH